MSEPKTTALMHVAPLRDLPDGTSYLRVDEVGGGTMWIQNPAGASGEFDVPVALDRIAAERALDAVGRPIAVIIRRLRHSFDCAVLGASLAGPRRVAISLGGALELSRRGVHCVLRCEATTLAEAS